MGMYVLSEKVGRGPVRAANALSHDLNGNYMELHTR